MEQVFEQFAQDYEVSVNKKIFDEDDQRAAYNPVIFVFIGDKVQEGINIVSKDIEDKWDNSQGVLYLNINSNNKIQKENVYNLQIPYDNDKKEDLRHKLYEDFLKNKEILAELNDQIIKIKNKILDYGKLYSFHEKVNISVITRVDDPLNVLAVPITLLLKSKLGEYFKIIYSDLFELIEERDESVSVGYSSAVAMSFFMEIEHANNSEFTFEENIDVQKDGIEIPVKKARGEVYDLVYVLGDRNSDGFPVADFGKKSFEIISYISLLKNRKVTNDKFAYENHHYNEDSFKRSIASKNGKQTYISAGIGKLKRPNRAIALTVLQVFYDNLLKVTKNQSDKSMEDVLKIFKFDFNSLNAKVEELIPKDIKLSEMNAIMYASEGVSPSALDGMNYFRAEQRVYGDNLQRFFKNNFQDVVSRRLEELKVIEDVKNTIFNDIALNINYGIYSAYEWTKEEAVVAELRRIRRNLEVELESYNRELKGCYDDRVSIPFTLRLFKDKAMASFKDKLFNNIYGLRLGLLRREAFLALIKKYEEVMLQCNEEIKDYIEEMEAIKKELDEAADRSINESEGYVGQNIKTYYTNVVLDVVTGLEKQIGPNFYFEDRFLGNFCEALRMGKEEVNKRLINICSKYILSKKFFLESFEEELHHRANVLVRTADNKVLSKKELFDRLYEILDGESKVNVHLLDYYIDNKYEEKYFFGDFESEFIRYAFDADYSSRTYALGCVHEKRSSGIEKLSLMGGFFIEHLRYYENSKKYFNHYKERGYKLMGLNLE